MTVGNMSYGGLDIRSFMPANEKLTIGDFVSIAENVIFILGGNHQVNTITPYPLYSQLVGAAPGRDARTKGPIIIEDEVWIGFGTIILSGTRIGKGAIIGAGSVVTADIPAYAIAGGNPAKVIRYRFDEDIRNAIADFSISQVDEKVISDHIQDFYIPLDMKQLEKIKKLRNNNKGG
ncbi:MAG: DapH/DapD/GlmU-related protein [Ferruginibacter sp.]